MTLDDGVIVIFVPLEIKVPDWFNADMDIGVQLSVHGVAVSPKRVTVDVSWTFFEHLASLACTGFIQSGMQQLAQQFMEHIVITELVPRVATGFKADGQP